MNDVNRVAVMVETCNRLGIQLRTEYLGRGEYKLDTLSLDTLWKEHPELFDEMCGGYYQDVIKYLNSETS